MKNTVRHSSTFDGAKVPSHAPKAGLSLGGNVAPPSLELRNIRETSRLMFAMVIALFVACVLVPVIPVGLFLHYFWTPGMRTDEQKFAGVLLCLLPIALSGWSYIVSKSSSKEANIVIYYLSQAGYIIAGLGAMCTALMVLSLWN